MLFFCLQKARDTTNRPRPSPDGCRGARGLRLLAEPVQMLYGYGRKNGNEIMDVGGVRTFLVIVREDARQGPSMQQLRHHGVREFHRNQDADEFCVEEIRKV